MKYGGIGVIEEGKLKGRKFIIPSEVLVETGTFFNGSPKFSKACLIHQTFIPVLCQKCELEAKEQEATNKEIGLL